MNLGLDLAGGAALAAAEMYGDWYRDPWSWPELSTGAVARLDVQADLGLAKSPAGEYHLTDVPHFHLMEVPKARLGVRPAVVQDPLSRLAYLSAVSANLGALHSDMPDWVYGWRVRGANGLSPNRVEWPAYTETLPTAEADGWGLITDSTSCFASVDSSRLREVLRDRIGNVTAFHVIMDVVDAHELLSSRSGIPQRSYAPAALAHAFLRPLDDVLAASLGRGVTQVRRWMDDISAEGEEEALFGLFTSLQEVSRQLGLELNASKTRLVSAAESAADLRLEDLREIEVPITLVLAGDYEDVMVEPDLDVLLRLEDEILSNPRDVKRPLVRAVLRTLRDQELFDRHFEWRENAKHLPHAADALSRYLRGAGEAGAVSWEELADWFEEYRHSAWARWDWVSSQYALVFPGSALPNSVDALLREWLEQSDNLQQVAIAVQRLGSVDPATVRTRIRARVDRTTDPLVLRVFGLGSLMAGDTRQIVEKTLTKDPRNRLLLRFLEGRDWRVPDVSKDFDNEVESDVQ